MKRNSKVTSLVTAAMIAALYVVLSFFCEAFGLASGAVQIRISEALVILTAFTPDAVPGVTIGCLLFNLLSGAALPDVIFGTVASLLGAMGSRKIAVSLKNTVWAKYLLPLPTVFSNAIIIPWVLKTAYHLSDAYWYLFATVGAGEVISCGLLGMFLYSAIAPFRNVLFRK